MSHHEGAIQSSITVIAVLPSSLALSRHLERSGAGGKACLWTSQEAAAKASILMAQESRTQEQNHVAWWKSDEGKQVCRGAVPPPPEFFRHFRPEAEVSRLEREREEGVRLVVKLPGDPVSPDPDPLGQPCPPEVEDRQTQDADPVLPCLVLKLIHDLLGKTSRRLLRGGWCCSPL